MSFLDSFYPDNQNGLLHFKISNTVPVISPPPPLPHPPLIIKPFSLAINYNAYLSQYFFLAGRKTLMKLYYPRDYTRDISPVLKGIFDGVIIRLVFPDGDGGG